jgi:hypothetical protein
MAMTRILNFGLVSLAQKVHRVESDSQFIDGSLDTSVLEAVEVAHGIPQHLKDKNEPFLILMECLEPAKKLIIKAYAEKYL